MGFTSVSMSALIRCITRYKPKFLIGFDFMMCILPRNFAIVKDGIDTILKNQTGHIDKYLCM